MISRLVAAMIRVVKCNRYNETW